MRDTITVLSIAGSDSGGGAGVQADLVAITDHGLHASMAITALTAQNTQGVLALNLVDPDIVRAQIRAVLDDADVRAIKIGMLGSAAHVHAVANELEALALPIPIVIDPVLVATSGDVLSNQSAEDAIRTRLWPHATLITPNLHEALSLTGVGHANEVESALLSVSPSAVLLTGGDRAGADVVDVYLSHAERRVWTTPRVAGGPFHGTGCTLSSAIAARLAMGEALPDCIASAIDYVQQRLRCARRPGKGAAVLGPHPSRGVIE